MEIKEWLGERVAKIRTTPNWGMLYAAGAVILIVVLPLAPRSWGGYIVFLGGVSLAAGFCVRAWPVLRYVWSRPWGKVVFTGANVAVAVVAHVFAVGAVAEALELSPELFGETVTLVSLMMVWPVWLFIISVVLALLTFGLFVGGMASESVRGFRTDAGLSTIVHACGAIALLLVVAYFLDNPLTRQTQRIEWIKRIAYHVDFHLIPRVPGAPTDIRAKVIENGWLVVAVERGGRIELDLMPAQSPDETDKRSRSNMVGEN